MALKRLTMHPTVAHAILGTSPGMSEDDIENAYLTKCGVELDGEARGKFGEPTKKLVDGYQDLLEYAFSVLVERPKLIEAGVVSERLQA